MTGASLKYLIKEGFRNTWTNRMMSIASICVLMSCLVLIGSASMIFLNIDSLLGKIEEENVIMVYISDDSTPDDIANMQNEINACGNIKSVEKALNYLGEEAIITRDHDEIVNSDKVILPGVGAFADAMEKIRHYGLEETIHEVVEKNIPFLGICLGLQLMFESSDEGPGVKGLGLLPGKILRIPKSGDLKIPHMGWNSLNVKDNARLFAGINANPYVYFVHSYYLKADNDDIVAASTEYSTHIHASVEKGNLFACQFHPEKSSETGLRILKNFAEL